MERFRIPLLFIGIGALLAFIKYSGGFNLAPKIKSPTPISQQASTNGWKTYSEGSYEFKLPSDWTQSVSSLDSNSWSAPDSSQISVRVDQLAGRTIDQYLIDSDKQSQSGWEGQASKKVLSSQAISVDSHTGVQRKEQWLAAGFSPVVSYLPMGTNVLIIAALPSSSQPENAQVVKDYDTILATFKFL